MIQYNRDMGKLTIKRKNEKFEIDIASIFIKDDIPTIQIMLYVMCGGGMLGKFAITNPANFYIDTRVGKLPYKKKDIIQTVHILSAIAEFFGANPCRLPEPNIPSCWIF